ncbi:MAG: ribonuclease J [Alphaproteobacteria bacterium]|nr:ribonuclease J [Alphaproteobacteria bacterium]
MTSPFEKENFYFTPFGGSEEFGVNLNLYALENEFLVIDCGIGFADERFPGIDLLLPDPKLLEQNKKKLKGLIITHAHEDHIGAVAYLWHRLECPIYCTAFTAAVLRKKLEQNGVKGVPVHIVDMQSPVKIGSFNIEFIPVSHSVPGSASVVIRTKLGNILHSGDWNLDPHPVVGQETKAAAFKKLAKEKIIAYIGDSTNAEVQGRAGSESDVAKGLAAEFKQCEGRIAVTLFSSNIGRLVSIARAAEEAGRKVAVAGRSLHRMIAAAHECGYMKGVPDFLGEEEIARLPRKECVFVVTGSQGEYRAALAKIARGDHPSIRLERGDTVIFSARAIPGNERNINAIKNALSAAAIKVISPRDTKNIIHVSGHPCREEIEEMYGWVRPGCVIPVHGERTQLTAQGQLARDCQISSVVIPNNGSVIRLAPGPVEIVDHVETGLLAVDQRRIIPSTHQSIIARRKLQYTGSIHISIVLDDTHAPLAPPRIDTVGLCGEDDKQEFEYELQEEVLAVLSDVEWDEGISAHIIEEEIRICLRRYVSHVLGFKPKTTVHVTIV